jgi:hypothetical protein
MTRLLNRPCGNCRVDCLHYANGFSQGGYDFLIVGQVVIGKRPAFAVFKPLCANLIAADLEIPDLRRYALKILLLVDPDAALLRALARFRVGDSVDSRFLLFARHGKAGDFPAQNPAWLFGNANTLCRGRGFVKGNGMRGGFQGSSGESKRGPL